MKVKVKLKDICDFESKGKVAIKKDERIPGPYPYHGSNNIQDHINFNTFDGEYILVAGDGNVMDEYHRPVIRKVSGKFTTNKHVHVLKNKKGIITYKYLYHILMSLNIYKIVNAITPQQLTSVDLKEVEVEILKDINEQILISKKLDMIMEQREEFNVEMRRLDNERRKINSIFFENNPKRKKLKDILEKINLGTQLNKKDYDAKGNVKIINLNSILEIDKINVRINELKIANFDNKRLVKGDVLLPIYTYNKNVVVYESDDVAIPRSNIMVLRPLKKQNPQFIRNIILSEQFRDEMTNISVRNSHHEHVNITNVQEIEIPYCSRKKQDDFVDAINSIMEIKETIADVISLKNKEYYLLNNESLGRVIVNG